MQISTGAVTVYPPGIASRFGKRMITLQRNVLKNLFGKIIDSTPVLTGRLKANWTVVKGKKNLAVRPRMESFDAFGVPTKLKMQKDVDAYVVRVVDSVQFINSVPYAHRIEYLGHSMKAPAGIIRPNMLKVKAIIKEEAAKLR